MLERVQAKVDPAAAGAHHEGAAPLGASLAAQPALAAANTSPSKVRGCICGQRVAHGGADAERATIRLAPGPARRKRCSLSRTLR